MTEDLGQIFIREGLISSTQLERALVEQRATGLGLGYALTKLGFVDDAAVAKLLAQYYGMPAVDLSRFEVDPKLLKLLPPDVAIKHTVLPLKREGRTLTVAIADPNNVAAIEDIKFITRCDVFPVIAGEYTLRNAIDRYYRQSDAQRQSLLKNVEAAEEPAFEEAIELPDAGPADDLIAPAAAEPPADVSKSGKRKTSSLVFLDLDEPPPPSSPPGPGEPGARDTREIFLVAPQPVVEPVLLGASAPAAVRPGEEFAARFVAYLKGVEGEVARQLNELSPRAGAHLGMAECPWRQGTLVKVRLSGKRLRVIPPENGFVWQGDRQFASFAVAVAPRAPAGGTVLKFEVFIKGTVVARLLLDLEISPTAVSGAHSSLAIEPARTAFASYASEDRDEVLGRVASLTEAAGLAVFLDSVSLHTGARWEEQLRAEITTRELFLLFWSARARRSKWVTWEWRTALKEKGLDAIQPHPLEPVSKAPPPKELSKLHFGNAYVLVREAYRNE